VDPSDGVTYWRGKIKFFNQQKNFGFIQLDRGTWLEIHITMKNLFRLVLIDRAGGHYSKWVKLDLGNINAEIIPKKDDRVVCRIKKRGGTQGLKLYAIMWCYEEEYNQYLKTNLIQARR